MEAVHNFLLVVVKIVYRNVSGRQIWILLNVKWNVYAKTEGKIYVMIPTAKRRPDPDAESGNSIYVWGQIWNNNTYQWTTLTPRYVAFTIIELGLGYDGSPTLKVSVFTV